MHQAIRAGIFNDLGSGSNVDMTIITKDGVERLRNYDIANKRPVKRIYDFPRGTTPVWRDLSSVVVEDGDAQMVM